MLWIDRDHMRAELRRLDDSALFTRTVEAIRLARWGMDAEGGYQPTDRAWCDCCWAAWRERGRARRYRDAVEAVGREERR